MNWQYTPYMIPIIISALIALGVAVIAWQRRASAGSLPLVVLMLSVALWSVAYALRLGSQDLHGKIFWARVRYIGIVFTPAAWYAFVVQYTERRHWLKPRNLVILALEPLAILFLVWTNGTFHHLIWREIHLQSFKSFVGWHADHGAAFWIHSAYNYLLLLFSILLLLQTLQRNQKLYRKQIYILLAGASIPLLINILAVFELTPIRYLDLTPFAFTLGGVIFAWGLFHLRLMDIVPVAYDTILDSIGDGVIVLDNGNRILNLNPAACQILNCRNQDMIGQPIQTLLQETCTHFLRTDKPIEEAHTEITIGEGKTQQYYELTINPMHVKADDFIGWCMVFHDVTSRRQAEQALRAQKQLYESLTTVSRATTEKLDLESTLENTLTVAASISGATGGSLFIVDASFSVTHSLFTYGAPEPKQVGSHTLDFVMESGLSGWVARNRTSALLADVMEDERWVPVPSQKHTRSALSVPIIGRQQALLGVLTLTHLEAGHFTGEHRTLMEAAAEQMALAWYNAQIYEEQLQLAKRMATLYEVLRTMGGELNPKAVPQIAVEAIARLTGWPAISILMPDEQGDTLITQATSNLVAVSQGWHTPVAEGSRGQAFRTGKTQYLPTIHNAEATDENDTAIRSRLIVPMRRGGHVLGLLDIASYQANAFDGDARLLGELLAESIALSVDVAQAHANIGRYVADLSTLFAISGVISRSMIIENLLAQTLEAALRAINFDSGIIVLSDQESSQLFIAAEQNLPHNLSENHKDDGLIKTLYSYTYQQGNPTVISDIERGNVIPPQALEDLPHIAEKFRQVKLRAYVGVPLLYQERPIGVLSLFSRPPKPSLSHNIALLMAMGRQIATAIVNAQLFRAVEDERGRLYALIESSQDGILFINMEQQIIVINARALELMQLPETPDYWKAHAFFDIFTQLRHKAPTAMREVLKEVRQVQENPEALGEGELEFPPHILYWLHMPVMRGGMALGRLIMLRDVTEQRLLARMRDDLTHTMVHDLRNPLAGISGALKLLTKSLETKSLSSSQQHLLKILDNSTQRTLNLVNAILDIGKLESGQMPINYSTIRLDALVTGVLDLQMPLAAEKGINLAYTLLTDSLEAWGDPNLIERVLQNLVGNAIKFTPTGGQVEVIVDKKMEAFPYYVISVKDTGSGVPLDVQGRLFQKFVTGNQVGRGSGLGLTFCRMVIEAHKERIWLADTSEQGTTFSFTLSLP